VRHGVAVMLTVVFLGPCVAVAATAYAGLTKAAAVAKARTAEYAAIAYGVRAGTVSNSQAKTLRHRIATETPKVTEGRCDGKAAWRVVWPKSTPILVGRGVGPKPATLCG
jgi:hypothetical protein